MPDYYAWTDILSDKGKVSRGTKVTKSGLGVSDADFKEMITSGSIRSKKFPAPEDYQGSPLDWAREELKEIQKMSAIEEEDQDGQQGLAEVMASEPS
jgi:hypothetical protein